MRGLAKSTIVLALYAYELLEELHPMTLRQLHYAIFSKAKIDYQNNKASYRKLSNVTSMSRRLNREIQLRGVTDEDAVNAMAWGGSVGGCSYEMAVQIVNLDGNTIPHDWIVDETRESEI